MEYQKQMMPGMLEKRNLSCNETKTEVYSACRKRDESYKKCKYLGSLLDTTEDMKRKRKALTTAAMKTYNPRNKAVSLESKLRIFHALVKPIFLYNA